MERGWAGSHFLTAGRSFPATADGYRHLLHWAKSFGVLRWAGVECTGSYGAALTRHLRAVNTIVRCRGSALTSWFTSR